MGAISYWEAIAEPAPARAAMPQLVTFGPIELELRAHGEACGRTYKFDHAQMASAQLTPPLALPAFRQLAEYVIIPGFEDRLEGSQLHVFDDMLRSGEWTNTAFHRIGDTLYVSNGVSGLRWDDETSAYDAIGMKADKIIRYDARSIPADWTFAPLGFLHYNGLSDLIADLYGRPFHDLPQRIQEHRLSPPPKDGGVRPVALWGHGSELCATRWRGMANK